MCIPPESFPVRCVSVPPTASRWVRGPLELELLVLIFPSPGSCTALHTGRGWPWPERRRGVSARPGGSWPVRLHRGGGRNSAGPLSPGLRPSCPLCPSCSATVEFLRRVRNWGICPEPGLPPTPGQGRLPFGGTCPFCPPPAAPCIACRPHPAKMRQRGPGHFPGSGLLFGSSRRQDAPARDKHLSWLSG